MITCQACGTENAPGTAYCTKCARKLDEETQQRVVRQRAEHTATAIHWTAILISGAVFVVLVVVIVFVLFATHVF